MKITFCAIFVLIFLYTQLSFGNQAKGRRRRPLQELSCQDLILIGQILPRHTKSVVRELAQRIADKSSLFEGRMSAIDGLYRLYRFGPKKSILNDLDTVVMEIIDALDPEGIELARLINLYRANVERRNQGRPLPPELIILARIAFLVNAIEVEYDPKEDILDLSLPVNFQQIAASFVEPSIEVLIYKDPLRPQLGFTDEGERLLEMLLHRVLGYQRSQIDLSEAMDMVRLTSYKIGSGRHFFFELWRRYKDATSALERMEAFLPREHRAVGKLIRDRLSNSLHEVPPDLSINNWPFFVLGDELKIWMALIERDGSFYVAVDLQDEAMLPENYAGLAGHRFELVNEEGSKLGEFVTGENGKARILVKRESIKSGRFFVRYVPE